MGNAPLVGTSMSNGTGSPYQLSGQNSVRDREWDGYKPDIKYEETQPKTGYEWSSGDTTSISEVATMGGFTQEDFQSATKTRTVAKTVRYLFVPSWQDYARSSEKAFNDELESDIAFTSICMTDTVFPYGCNDYHSSIAQNYDLSVSPNVAGKE